MIMVQLNAIEWLSMMLINRFVLWGC